MVRFKVEIVRNSGALPSESIQTTYADADGGLDIMRKADELVIAAPPWLGGNMVEVSDAGAIVHCRHLKGDWDA